MGTLLLRNKPSKFPWLSVILEKKVNLFKISLQENRKEPLRLFIYVFVAIIHHYTQSELTYKQDGMEPQLGTTEREFVLWQVAHLFWVWNWIRYESNGVNSHSDKSIPKRERIQSIVEVGTD